MDGTNLPDGNQNAPQTKPGGKAGRLGGGSKGWTEDEVREMRDNCYGHRISDLSWDTVRENWLRDAEWLAAHQPNVSLPVIMDTTRRRR